MVFFILQKILFNLLGHDVQDEGDVLHIFKDNPDPKEKAKNFAENSIYNKKVKYEF